MIRAYEQLKARRDSTVAVMLEEMLQVPAYASWARNHQGALKDELHHALSITLDAATTGEPATAADLEFFRDIGHQRGTQRFPLNDMRAGFRLSYLAGLRELFGFAETGNYTELADFNAYASTEHPRMLEVAELAFLSAYRDLGDVGLGRLRLLERLLEGRDVETFALQAEVELAQAFLVLVFRLPARVDADLGDHGDRLRRCFDDVPSVLWRCENRQAEVLVLIPADQPDSGAVMAKQLAASLHMALNRELVSTQALATTAEAIPQAYQEAKQALSVATAMPDIRIEPYRVDELLVELAIARQPEVLERLERLLEPLAAGTDLRPTLESLFAHDLDRGPTARSLYIHRRTLTYRIQRIHELTGIDPVTPHGIQLLRAALTATRLR